MGNSLNVNLEKGQRIQLTDGRIVIAIGGFGMASYTSGTALIVKDQTGKTHRVSGHDIQAVLDD